MPDQKQTLEYSRPTPRFSLLRLDSVFSIVTGVAVTITSLGCFWAIDGYDDIHSAILRRAYDEHWVLFLPPVAVIGVVAGVISWKKTRSTASIFGIVLSSIAFAVSMVPCAIDRVLYFMRH